VIAISSRICPEQFVLYVRSRNCDLDYVYRNPPKVGKHKLKANDCLLWHGEYRGSSRIPSL
jgi:hypothetical protein